MLGRYDFSSPYMKASILQNVGTSAELRTSLNVQGDLRDPSSLQPSLLLGTDAGGGAEFMFANTSYLSSVTVSMDLGFVPTIDLTLTPTLEDGRKIIDSTLLEYAKSALEVEIGYATGPGGKFSTPPFQGILQPPEVSFGPDVTITLKGVGTAGYYLAATAGTGTGKKQSRNDHIIDLVKALPQVRIDRSRWVLDANASKKLEEQVSVPNSGKSYLHVISQLARQCGCWIKLADHDGMGFLTLVAQAEMVRGAPIALLTLYDFGLGSLGPSVADRGIFPILSVTVGDDGQKGIFLNGWAKTLGTNLVNKTTGETSEVSATPANSATNGGADAQVGVKGPSNDLSKVVPPKPDSDETDAQSETQSLAAMLSNSNSIGLKLDIETLGLPDAFPGLLYQVSGVSKRIDGYYTCFGVKHSMSASGFTTSLTLIQNSQLMVQAILDKISPTEKNLTKAIPLDVGTNSNILPINNGVTIVPFVQD